ncbi:DNA recombination protein RmuC [uncultured Helicobacter sp.]|uniref:DNA recombination protein RmuC n=1 Tax=uncultured Helicobacter sp. TaxID=175537 RepID=UPI00374F86CC
MLYITIGLLGAIIMLALMLVRSLLQNTALRKDTQALITQVDLLQKSEQALKAQITQSNERYNLAMQDNARAQAQIQSQAGLLESLEQKYAHNLAMLKAEFERALNSQSQRLLEQNKLHLLEDSKKMLDSLFAPVRASIEAYKEGIKEYKDKLAENEIRLETNIKNMFAYSQEIGQNADKLAQILKGDKKIRGNFAEIQLKNVLEHSGLIEGEQYRLEAHFMHEGSGYRPDAVVYLDKHKSIIIDSKFPLPSGFSFESLDVGVCQEIAHNLKNRIDELAKKPYASFESGTYEFVLLFIPYQNILDLALSVDSGIYQYAYTKKVYLTTPHTLFMALKTIEVSWVHIQSDEKVKVAFEEIGRFYDKFVGITEDFEALKKLIERLGKQSDEIDSKLTSGRGSLASRFESLKKLGAKTSKRLATKDLLD